MGKRFLFRILLLAACARPIPAEDRPVALVFCGPGEEIRQETMDLASAGFTEGLVKAGTWRVVERQDLDLLLRAQEILLSDAFAEGDAVRAGSLLSADLVVTLSAASASGGIVLRARALDPGSGVVKLSETVTVKPEADLAREASLLAFLLAGVPVPQGASTGTGSGSLTVSADRDGAEVLLDGKPRGRTPLVLDPIAFGRYALEIRAGSLVYAAPVTVDGNVRVHGSLILTTGSLIVETRPPGAQVRIGNASYGAKGLIEKVPAERQTVTLTLPGWYWRGIVPILPGKTARISVGLERTAVLRVDAAPEVVSRLSGGGILEEFSGARILEGLPAGTYTLTSSRPDRRTETREIRLAAGEDAPWKVLLPLSAEAEIRAASLRGEAARLREADRALALPGGYLDGPVPDLGGLAVGNVLLAVAPLADILLLFPPADLPEAMQAEATAVRTAHFGLGLAAQAGFAAAILVGEGPWRIAAAAVAAAAAAADVVLGAVFGIPWADWTADMRARKAAHEEYARRTAALEADLARYLP